RPRRLAFPPRKIPERQVPSATIDQAAMSSLFCGGFIYDNVFTYSSSERQTNPLHLYHHCQLLFVSTFVLPLNHDSHLGSIGKDCRCWLERPHFPCRLPCDTKPSPGHSPASHLGRFREDGQLRLARPHFPGRLPCDTKPSPEQSPGPHPGPIGKDCRCWLGRPHFP